MDYLTIALAKGRLGKEAYEIFDKVGLGSAIDLKSRKLTFVDERLKIKYIYVKPSDVITYVENGVSDLGIVGKDSILENDADCYELFDLNIGKCKFSIAGFEGKRTYQKDVILKVATKYPLITKRYFEERNQRIQIIKLNGSVELAPLVGLSDCIVDIVETGNTLKANGLVVLEDMFEISAKLIANKVSYRYKLKRIETLMNQLKEVI